MDVRTITMDPTEAQRQVDLYRNSLKSRGNTTDRMLLRAYKRLAAGQRLIDVVDVLRNSAFDNQGRPRLALARATATWCEFKRSGTNNGSGRFLDLPRAKGKSGLHEYGAGTFKTWQQIGLPQQPRDFWDRSRARVPLIPVYLRPHKALDSYFILFEAEWNPIPPKDPFLLKQLHDNLFVVVAWWNLTELERAVLQGMMRKEQTT